MTTRYVTGRPLPLQAPTAFVRIRPATRALRRVEAWSALTDAAHVLIRIGSRGSRLALTQAERAAEALRRPGVEIALVPITTAGDRDRTKPFGEIGERGVFVKELEEALLAGRIDVAVHSAKDMTSTDVDGSCRRRLPAARGSARRALRRRRDPGGDAYRDRIRPTSCAAARARADALDRAAAREHRHAAAQAAASAGSTRSCSRPAASTGSGSSARSAYRFDPERAAAGGGAGRARAPGAGRRGGARRPRRRRGDAPARRGGAALRRSRRRWLSRAGRGVSRRRRR